MTSAQTNVDIKSTEFYKYHHATKHTVEKLMSYGHRLDWNSQPNPFLHFKGAPTLDLPTQFEVSNHNFFETVVSMIESARQGFVQSETKTAASLISFLSNLLFYGMAISAWKQVVGTDHKWALRANASSGNLHPTDTNVLVREDSDELKAGLYHYRVDEHKLEQRASGDLVTQLLNYLQLNYKPPQLVLCLSSIFFREAWKYRDRAFRYCQHDMGHALGALSVSAAALGWTARIITLFPDEDVSNFLGLYQSSERPLALVLLYPQGECGEHDLSRIWASGGRTKLTPAANLNGTACKLTSKLIDYSSINSVYESTKYDFDKFVDARKRQQSLLSENPKAHMPGTIAAFEEPLAISFDVNEVSSLCLHKSVHQTVRGRRSAVDMDGKTGMARKHFDYILRTATLGFPADFQGVDELADGVWKAASQQHLVHLYLYVHRVEGLKPGLYFFNRFEGELVPLLLQDQRETAMSTSCFQEIACDGAFSVSMIADFETAYKLYGDRGYRLVHYEAGYIGQLLYLASYALGHDATGIGCFVDDAINNYLGLDEGKEVIYNFTFGKAVLDARLTTLPSYDFTYPEF